MNREKILTITNILHAQAQVDRNCQFGEEVHSLAEEYSNTLLRNKSWDGK